MDLSALYPDQTPDGASPTWGDYGLGVKSAVEGIGADLAAVKRWKADVEGDVKGSAASRQLQHYFSDLSEDDIEKMTPVARDRLNAAITDPDFYQHPVSSAMLKATGMAPYAAMAFIPGGLVADAAAAVAFGGLNAASSIRSIYEVTDKLSDGELRQQMPFYDGLRSMGVDEDDARAQASEKLRGMKPLINFAVGAAAGALGPIRQAGRGIMGEGAALAPALESRGAKAVLGGVEGGAAMGAQSGVANYTQQQAAVEAGSQKEIDQDKLASAVLEGGVLGGLPGAALGGIFKGKHAAKEGELKPSARPEDANDATKAYGTGSNPPPRQDIEVGNEGSKPTRSDQEYGKRKVPVTSEGNGVTQPGPLGPDVTQAAALQPENLKTQAQPQTAAPSPAPAVSQPSAPPVKASDAGAPVGVTPETPAPPPSPRSPVSNPTGAREAVATPAKTTVATQGSSAGQPRAPLTTDRVAALVDGAMKHAETREIKETPMPSGANSSKDINGPVYVDPRVPPELRRPVAVHETVEQALMAEGMDYKQAHPIATRAEKLAVEKAGMKWEEYTHRWDGLLSTIEKEKPASLPPDLHVDPEQAIGHHANKLAPENKVSTETPKVTRTGKILESQTKESKANAEATAKSFSQRVSKNIAELEKPKKPTSEAEGGPSHKSKAAQEARAAKETAAQQITERHTPAAGESDDAVVARAKSMLDEAAKHGVKIPVVLKGDSAKINPHTALLRFAADLVRAVDSKKGKADNKYRTESLMRFRDRELDVRGGDLETALGKRRSEGDSAKQVTQGDVEAKAAPAEHAGAMSENEAAIREDAEEGFDTEHEAEHAAAAPVAVRDSETKTSDQTLRGTGSEGAASEVRKPTVSAEEKARIAAEFNAKVKKEADYERAGVNKDVDETPQSVNVNVDKAARAEEVTEEDKYAKISPEDFQAKLDEYAGRVARGEIGEGVMRAQLHKYGPTEGQIRKALEAAGAKSKPEPKLAPKTKAVKERIEAAAKKVDREPTEAQKEAGNYEKGHVSVHGLDVTIETPRGAERSGVTRDGKKWSVTMPDHYGYIKGTEGKDGDHVDVLLGKHPESPHVWVLDQVDPDTKAFDEHKVLLGYNKLEDAIGAYDRSFSDGRGLDRINAMPVHMAVSEFKEWLKEKGATKKPAEAESVHARDLRRDGKLYLDNDKKPTPVQTLTGREALRTLNFNHLDEGPSRQFSQFMRKRLAEIVGDTPVHVIDQKDMEAWTGREQGRAPGGLYEPDSNVVYINSSHLKDPLNKGHILLHELAHAATIKVLNRSKEARAVIRRIMTETIEFADTMDPTINQVLDYGFTNENEFVAEAFSNPYFQQALARMPASQELQTLLKLTSIGKRFSLWDTFVAGVRKALGLQPGVHTLMEATIRLGGLMMEPQRETLARRGELRPATEAEFHAGPSALLSQAIGGAKQAAGNFAAHPVDTITDGLRDRLDASKPLGKRLLNALTPNHILAEQIKKILPHARPIFEMVERQGVRANELKKEGTKLASDMIKTLRQYPDAFKEWSTLVNEQTAVGVDASQNMFEGRNKYLTLSKENMKKLAKGTLDEAEANMGHWRALNAYTDLATKFKALPGEFKELQDRLFKYFADSQREMVRGHINEFLRPHIEDEARRQRHAVKLTAIKSSGRLEEAFTKMFDENTSKLIMDAKKLAGSEGPYSPLNRFGDYVVGGKYKVEEPKNAINHPDENTWEFKTRAEAHKFAIDSGLHFTADTAYYDPVTGEKTTKTGGISTAGTPDQRFAVTLQRQHTEFHETEAQAKKAQETLKKSGLLEADPYLEAKQDYIARGQEIGAGSLSKIMATLERGKEYQAADEHQKAEMRRAMTEAALVTRAGNRIQSRRLPRRRVEGASEDLVHNVQTYNDSQANYRAKLQFRPRIEEALQEMHQFVKDQRYDTRGNLSPDTLRRSEAANEVDRRVRAQDPNEYTGKYTDWMRRVTTWSYISTMMRPSHLILHQTHLPMITVPAMAGRHGAFNAYSMMTKTWKQAVRAYKQGAQDTYGSVRDMLREGTDFQKSMTDAFANSPDGKRIGEMFKELGEIGLIHLQAGIEVHKHQPSAQATWMVGKLDSVIQRLDTVFRHATNATEAINRYVGAATAYRLEYARAKTRGATDGLAHQRAVEYARETLASTQGYYTATNAAPLFKNKYIRPFLMFRQFPLMIYHLLAGNAAKVFKGASKEERVQALGSLLAVLAAHTAMTGLLGGLPLEAAKIGGMLTKAMHVTPGDWNDVEKWVYEQAVQSLGKEGADWVMHGAARHLFGVDLHHRLGLNSFFTFGLPTKFDKKEIGSYLFEQALGAPEGLAENTFGGLSDMVNGNVVSGAFKAFPSQELRDLMRAYNGGSPSGKYKYTPVERVGRALGFTPAGEAEQGERAAEMAHERDEYNTQKNALIKSWVTGDKVHAWTSIQKFNAGLPPAARITMSQLQQAKQRAATPGRNYMGLSFNKQNQFIADRDRALYP